MAIADKLNNLRTKLENIELDDNTSWFKYFPYDADLRVKYANELESRLSNMFHEHINNKEVLYREDFFLLYLSWLSFIANDKGIDIDNFENTFKVDIPNRCDTFSTYAMNSEDTKKINNYILYGEDTENADKKEFQENKQKNDVDHENDEQKTADKEKESNLLKTLVMLVFLARRSRDIARNETDVLCNEMLHNVAVEIYGKHKWVSERDRKVRRTHQIADGQIKPINEPFEVGNSLLMYPGDESLGADPSEIILCRCHEEFIDRKVIKTNE